MLVAYKAHADFLIAELGALGNHPDWQASQANAIESLRDTLQSIPRDVVDGMNLMNELKKGSGCIHGRSPSANLE